MLKKSVLTIIIAAAPFCGIFAQSRIMKDFAPVCDSMSVLTVQRTGVAGHLRLKSVMKRGNLLDFYFTESLSDFPWREEDMKWFRNTLRGLFPDKYSSGGLGGIYARGDKMETFAVERLGFSGNPSSSKSRVKDTGPAETPLVVRSGRPEFPKGLSGRHIALWASHGRYYDQGQHRWQWQRPCLFQTVEDLFTSSFVLPFLAPMLENAGACVLMPRERDANPEEIVIDNDKSPEREAKGWRGSGTYRETGKWKDAGTGFADMKEVYSGTDNPFTMGTARMAECLADKKGERAEIQWNPDFAGRTECAVYVSYKSLPNSTESANYTVRHLGGETNFVVNQKMGGGTWIYLGTFEFADGCGVTLDNVCPKGRKPVSGSVVTADAVKFGGGLGNVARYDEAEGPESGETSGMPRYAEAARYWLQWAGMDESVYSQHDMKNDYRDDLFARTTWVERLAGGSRVNPGEPGLKIPVDAVISLHSDAGTAPGDSIVGTLAIYSSRSGNSRKFPDGGSMTVSREFADIVQSQIAEDLSAFTDGGWTRRQIWDRGYRETRAVPVPAVLIESLSHQNFADMRYGLDPEFRFVFSRAMYKGLLKFLSNRYGVRYAVQPLPVNSFAAVLEPGCKVALSWRETEDASEPTSPAKGYMLYTRHGDGGFDNGTVLETSVSEDGLVHASVKIEPGEIYSYRITAYNDGGESFPSETLSVGIPLSAKDSYAESAVLIVNNFTRLSPPAWFDTPSYAGFENSRDNGVPCIKEISFTGEMYEKRRSSEWSSNENPGFGASYNDMAGTSCSGNTFDFPRLHGQAIFEAGYPFCSAGAAAFAGGDIDCKGLWAADIICGKQVSTPLGHPGGRLRHSVFPEALRKALESYAGNGGNIIISGEYIGTDIHDGIYPAEKQESYAAAAASFAADVLGIKWKTDCASRGSIVKYTGKGLGAFHSGAFSCKGGSAPYAVASPDGIEPASPNGCTAFRYTDTGISAGVCFTSPRGYRTVSFGFPLECVSDRSTMNALMKASLDFVKGR